METFISRRYFPPKMGGLFGTVGGDLMFMPHFGVGAESSFRMSQGAYAGLKYRPTFYDFNGIGSRFQAPNALCLNFRRALAA
jgi:hypothetical protein